MITINMRDKIAEIIKKHGQSKRSLKLWAALKADCASGNTYSPKLRNRTVILFCYITIVGNLLLVHHNSKYAKGVGYILKSVAPSPILGTVYLQTTFHISVYTCWRHMPVQISNCPLALTINPKTTQNLFCYFTHTLQNITVTIFFQYFPTTNHHT